MQKKLLVLLIPALVFELILIFFVRHEPTGDEIWAMLLSRADFSQIWLASFSELHAPFYFLMIRLFNLHNAYQMDVNTMRLLSLCFGLLSLIAIFKVSKLFFGQEVAKISLVLSSLLPSLIWSSVYARYYSLLILLCTLAIWVFWYFLKSSKIKYAIFLIIISTVGIYTHYYFVLLDFAFFVFLAFSKKYRKLIWKLLLTDIVSGILISPAIYFFWVLPKPELSGRHTNDLLKIIALPITNFTSWESLVFLYYRGNFFLYIWVFVLLAVSSLVLMFLGYKQWKSDFKNVVLSIILTPVVLAVLFSYTVKPLLALGSLVIFLPAYVLLISKGVYADLKSNRIFTAVFSIALIFSIVFFVQASFSLNLPRRDFELMLAEFRSDDMILHNHLYSYLNGVYYFGSDNNFAIHGLPIASKAISNSLNIKEIDKKSIPTSRRIWLVVPQGEQPEEYKLLQKYLEQNFWEEKKVIFPWTLSKFQEYYFNVYLYAPKG